ncbi:YSIRK-type signal peptide-containing protein [Streptococcus sp. Marseille-Q5986]|uniref:YSIRK-type signal peptide-containing protein n=1 Tax=Streptococcus sp. Marseille-Q5986 TaxID=2972782 RepID=UPI003A5C6601
MIITRRFCHKIRKEQRFSIRKYAVGAASVLIGFTFSAQVVSADGITPAPTAEETVQTVQESPQAVKEAVGSKVPEKLEGKADKAVKEEIKEDQETPRTVAPTTEESSAPVVTENTAPTPTAEKEGPAQLKLLPKVLLQKRKMKSLHQQ